MNRKPGHYRAGLRRRVRADAAYHSTRREFLISAVAWPAVAWAGAVFAQAKPPVLIGWLSLSSRETSRTLTGLKEGLAALGWKEGSNYVLDERWADGREDRLLSLAKELATKKPAVIVTSSMLVTIRAANVAGQIPIVMISGTDPVVAGVLTGGNVVAQAIHRHAGRQAYTYGHAAVIGAGV